MWNIVEPVKSLEDNHYSKMKSWAITDARIAGRCFTRGMCNRQAVASVRNAVSKWAMPKKKKNTGKQ
jgi:hypothetical protein